MLKNIPYALLLLAVYVLLTFSSAITVFSSSAAEVTTIWDRIGLVTGYIIALGPIALAVLALIQTIKPVVGQLGGLVCILLALSYGYRAFQIYPAMREYLEITEHMDMQAIYLLESFLSSLVFAILFWLVGAKIQDEEVSGLYSFVSTIGMGLIIITALSGTSYDVMPLNVVPLLLLMYTAKKLPAVFVTNAHAIGIKVKNIVIMAIIVAAYYILPTSLF